MVIHNDTTSQEIILNMTFYGTFHIELINYITNSKTACIYA